VLYGHNENVDNVDHTDIENETSIIDETRISADQLLVLECSYQKKGKNGQLMRIVNVPNLKCPYHFFDR
jgi:hypothetical protein